MKVKEGVFNGRIGPVKTECSEAELPLDPDFATILLENKRKSSGSGLVLPSPAAGRSYHASPIQQDYIRRAGWSGIQSQSRSEQRTGTSYAKKRVHPSEAS